MISKRLNGAAEVNNDEIGKILDSYYLSDFTPVADYALVFDDMIATPLKYQPVYSGTLTDGFGWNYDEHADPNFYWLVVPTSAGLPDLTLTPHLSIDGKLHQEIACRCRACCSAAGPACSLPNSRGSLPTARPCRAIPVVSVVS